MTTRLLVSAVPSVCMTVLMFVAIFRQAHFDASTVYASSLAMDAWGNNALFPSEATVETRVMVTAPAVNSMIAEFFAAKLGDGVQVFQEALLEKIRAAGLLKDGQFFQCDVVGVHPDNREGTGIVPGDAHDLVQRIFLDGWRMKLVDCVACYIPPTAEGKEWRNFNEKLAQESGGLLPPCQPSFLQIVTSRGSHTTAGLRIVKMGARAVHDDLALDGRVSSSKICEHRQDSLHCCAIIGVCCLANWCDIDRDSGVIYTHLY